MVRGRPEHAHDERLLVQAAWRVVGAVESPLKNPELSSLVDGVLGPLFGQGPVAESERRRVRETVSGWYETRDGRPALAQDAIHEVDDLVLRGAAQQLLEGKSGPPNEALFWAIGSLDAEAAAETIRVTWRPKQVDALWENSVVVLQRLCERENVINPDEILGYKVDGGRVSVDPEYKRDRVRVFRRTDLGRPYLYGGVANIIRLIMILRPDRFPELVENVDHPIIQRWALFIVTRYKGAGRFQALDWLEGNPSEPVTAIAIVHVLEVMRELVSEARHPGGGRQEREEASGAAAQLLSGLVDRLARYEPAESVRWLAELYEHGDLPKIVIGESAEHDLGERLEERCIDEIAELVRQNWHSELRGALRSKVRQGDVIQRTLPLGTVAQKVSRDHPDRAVEIAKIVLEKHEEHTDEILRGNERAYYTLTDGRTIKWMRGLGSALSLALPEDETPLDWVIAQCSRLPLSVWDADDHPEKFRVADDVAQMQMAVAIHAVVAKYEAGVGVEPEMVRNLAERVWEHCHFVGRREGYRLEEPEVEELAARVLVELGNPNEEWLIVRVKSGGIGPRGLWGMVDAYVKRYGDPVLADELSSNIAAQYRYIKSAEISTLRYLARIWQILGAADPALLTADTMLEYHERAMQREDHLEVMNLRVLAVRKKSPTKDSPTSEVMRSIKAHSEYLWRNHIPGEEIEIKRSVDALLA